MEILHAFCCGFMTCALFVAALKIYRPKGSGVPKARKPLPAPPWKD